MTYNLLLGLAAALIALGFLGLLLNQRHLVRVLLALEVCFLGLILLFITLGRMHDNLQGAVIALFLLGVAGAEAGIALALLLAHFRNVRSIAVHSIRGGKHDT